MWETIGSIVLKYWVEFLLASVVGIVGFFGKRYLKLEKEDRKREQTEFFEKLAKNIQQENTNMINSLSNKYNELEHEVEGQYTEITTEVSKAMIAGRDESKADDEVLQDQISNLSDEMRSLKKGLLSIQGKEFRANCRKLLEDGHEITLDEWEEIDADHEAYNGLGGNHKGDQLYSLVKKKAEKILTDWKKKKL
mgnify:FL=1